MAIKYKHTPMTGRTHGVHAEPITFGLKLALWFEEMNRNRQRLTEARKAIAVGMISGVVVLTPLCHLRLKRKPVLNSG